MARKTFKDSLTTPFQTKGGYIRRNDTGKVVTPAYTVKSGKHVGVKGAGLKYPNTKRLVGMATQAAAKSLAGSIISQVVVRRPSQERSQGAAFYPAEVFDSKEEYDASVENVVARIKSGQAKARTPDE